ncbi:hypothetical protein FRC04_008607 [Tulasnella sp. 424]|nr:hypothetical protein FRC04_008607 [Tulasnella sp. 424]KAG8965677.1 hypothetical protein FRC05_003065 [Tulasnella sp. 425]
MFYIQRPVSLFPQSSYRPDYYQQSPEERYYRQVAEEHNRRAELALRLAQQERERVLRERELRAIRARQYQEQVARRSQYEQLLWDRRRSQLYHVPASEPAFDLALSFANQRTRGYSVEPVQVHRHGFPEARRSVNRQSTSFLDHLLQALEAPVERQTEGAKQVRFDTEQAASRLNPQPAKKDKGKARAPVQEEATSTPRQDGPKPVDHTPAFWDFFGGLHALQEEDALVRQLNLFDERSFPGVAQQGVAGPSGVKHAKQAESSTTARSASVPAPVRAPASAPSTPSSASSSPKSHAASFTSIDAIQSRFDNLKSTFVFPATPQFESATSTSSGVPRLSYASSNTSVHEYENELTKLLTKLDAVESDGAESIRGARKALVVAVENELEKLDEEKKTAWRNSVVEEETSAHTSESNQVLETSSDLQDESSEEESTIVPVSVATGEEVRGYDLTEPAPSVPVPASYASQEPQSVEVAQTETSQENSVAPSDQSNHVETADPTPEKEVETREPTLEGSAERVGDAELEASEQVQTLRAQPSVSSSEAEAEDATAELAERQQHSDMDVEPFVDVQEASPVVSEASLGEFDTAALVEETTQEPSKDLHASDDEFEML